ncbi:DUF3300 domain-containing protein [Klebsiella quasipneumoniae]|uniref:DUF3300 domain-containing protein n=1 Tax=Klebsiella quasipneumoniae TaxID=1463165 RepID=UPI0002C40BBB|nr:DUF3300 domain-containing protein [Klebsiella quasipneumoniae]AMR14448.1 hypothetical protein AVR78_08840 [Klebsiella quasipneumoniae]AVF87820.1 DUF3300 domain-containing protein [Klebsiella quasipneumoniae]AWO60656.1 DUF3300 domain-containing protein [Klebsiella quasipneumoniae subsp. similipneumoniae]EMR20543.1 hypothetical protein KP700603_13515 [Klebsiella quasipneumoniae]MBK5764534.1 DUF3300 domain-containing protein [Klebsiella quasipneumoniae]
MSLPFKPHIITLLCSAGLLAAAGTLYVQSRTPETVTQPTAQPAPAPTPAAPAAAEPVAATYTQAQIDQWVAPIALYPDSLLSQVLMASTYPDNVMQAVQWSQDNPTMKGDPAVQAVASQPWDPSVKSLVAFPALLAMMGENPPWVENLGNVFLAQPHDVMDSVQRLRAIAQETGTLKSTPQQKVIVAAAAPVPATTSKSSTVSTSSTTAAAPAPTQVIKIEPTDPQVVYVPNYNPSTVYGTWPNSAYPPVYLPPPPGEQFTDSFVKGFGYSLGVATTWALFSSIDWDDDDDHHHHDDDYHRGDYSHNGDNININVNNFNRITGQNLPGDRVNWQHNPAYRGHVPYPDNTVAQRFHQTNVSGGLSATQHAPVDREAQRQAAMTQLQQRSAPTATAGNLAANTASRDAQRQAASAQLKQATQRSNYRGYDSEPTSTQQRRDAAKAQLKNPTQQQQRRQQLQSATPAQRQQTVSHLRASALSGNESRAPSWQAQQERGRQSRQFSSVNREQRDGARERLSEHHELRRR